jgi:hypothetical protein
MEEDTCWFCGEDGLMCFTWEFDAYYHVECLEKELKNNNPEAVIIQAERDSWS